MKNKSLLTIVAALTLLTALISCGKKTFELKSTAFRNGEFIPDKYCYGGIGERENISLPFNWANPPVGTKSFALVMISPGHNYIRWAVFNIPPNCNEIKENASGNNMPDGSIELKNYWRTTPAYYGPEPEVGMTVNYTITLYALNTIFDDISGYKSFAEINTLLDGKVIAKAEITGIKSR